MRFIPSFRTVRRIALPILMGATVFQIQNCSQPVRDSFLTGIQTSLTGLVTSLINTFFLVLTTTTIPTTQTVI